jgi:hypothetical protein
LCCRFRTQATTVLVDEFDAGGFERSADREPSAAGSEVAVSATLGTSNSTHSAVTELTLL